MHVALGIALRHLLMDDAAARRHPLNIPRRNRAAVAHAIAVLHRPGEYVCNGFDTAVGMPRESGQILTRDVVAEVVEQQKWVEIRRIAEAESAPQVDA